MLARVSTDSAATKGLRGFLAERRGEGAFLKENA